MTIELETDDRTEKLVSVLGNVLMQSVNEGLVLAQLEAFEFFEPMPAPIPLGKGTPLETKLDELSVALGDPPRILVMKEGDNPARYDTYVNAAIREIVSAFLRARTSVCRTHLYFIGSSLIKLHPEWMHLPEDPNVRRILMERVEECFLGTCGNVLHSSGIFLGSDGAASRFYLLQHPPI